MDAIQNLDLHFVIERLVKKQKWSQEEATEAVRRYKNFLTLIYLYPGERVIPTPDIDEAWHAHILFTREYASDCQTLFNKYLHHAPVRASATQEEVQEMNLGYCRTAALYHQTFQEAYSLELDIATFW
jgi:hypothetical protein